MELPMPRRRFLGRLAAVLGGLAVVPALAGSAQARSRRRYYGGWGGYPVYRRGNSHRRFYGPGYGGYGYGGYAPRTYYAPAPGYYAAPPRVFAPAPRVYYGTPAPYYPPLMRVDTPARDALALLEL